MAQVSPQAYHFYVCHLCGARTALRTKFPEFCPEFPLLLCIIGGILECLFNPSWLQLCRPMASSSSVYSSCHCCTISRIISLSDIEAAAQRKIMVTKTLDKRKSHHKKPKRLPAFVFSCSPCQRKGNKVYSRWKETGPFCTAGTPGLLLARLLVPMAWALEENHWDLLALPPSWASTASSSLGGLSSDGGLVLLLLVWPRSELSSLNEKNRKRVEVSRFRLWYYISI